MRKTNDQSAKKVYSNIKNNFYMLRLVFKICPSRILADFILSFLNYFSWVFYSILFVKYLFGAIQVDKTFQEIVLFVVMAMIVFCIIELYSAWYHSRFRPLTDQVIYFKLNKILFDKATQVDISCYENPDFYNNYTKALQEANVRAVSVLDSTTSLVSALMSSLFVLYTMYTIEPMTIIFSLLPVTGNFVLGKILGQYDFHYNNDNIPYNRRKDYINRTVYLQDFAKEIRLSNIFNVLKNSYNKAYEGIIGNINKYGLKIFFVNFIKGFVCFPLIFEGVWLYTAYKAIVTKTLTIGDFAVMSSAIVSSTWMLINLSNSITTSVQNGIYIENFKQFLGYKEKISEDQDGICPGGAVNILEFRNVGFTYDHQKEPVLKNINMKIAGGERIALVGHNGAGKTTLVKLMMRLYDPTEGEILLNGINIKEYNLKQYRKLFGTVFQDYQVLSMSVLENVVMNEIETDEQRERALEALKKSGVYEKITTLGKGPDTVLTREFDDEGAVLSGGEYQKIAISRVFVQDNSIVILDEPSSALDPVAEYNIYNTMMKACETSAGSEGKAIVFISHRLSSAVLADRIYLLENGEVIEQGTHEELLKANLKYTDMFMKQAQNYLDGKDYII